MIVDENPSYGLGGEIEPAAISDTQFADWLASRTAQRVTLFEITVNVGDAEITRYLSDKPYAGGTALNPYLSIVEGGIKIPESISLTAEATLSAGDIELNHRGRYYGWVNDVWANRSIKVYVGDVRWPRTDFRQVFGGIVDDCVPKGRTKLSLKLRDKFQDLNTPLSEVLLGGSTINKDKLIPLLFGECHNITPLLINPNNYTYQIHNGIIERIIEVRDNGRKLDSGAYITNLNTGTFTLLAKPVGVVTVSAQGAKLAGVYVNTIAKIIELITTQFGKASTRWTGADIDTANFTSFNTANAQPVGAYFADRVNVLEACRQLASSVAAQFIPSRTGQGRLIQINFPGSAVINIPASVQLDQTITPTERTKPQAAVKIGYAKNWTVQDNLETGIPEEHKDLYKKEWLTAGAVAATVLAKYKLNSEAVQRDTCLLTEADAQAEANRYSGVVSVPRTTFKFEGTPSMMTLALGDAVNLYSNEFELSAGKVGVVTSLVPDWSNYHVEVGVTI